MNGHKKNSWIGYFDPSEYGISCHLVLTFRTLIDLFNFPEAQKYCCSISEVAPLFQDMLSVLSAVHRCYRARNLHHEIKRAATERVTTR